MNNVLGNLNANGLIKFKVDINLYDLPILTTKGSQMLLNKDMRRYFETNYGSNWINIFKSIDGQKTLKTLSNIIETNIIQFKKLITDFLGKGYIELLSEKLEQVIIIEDLYKKYYDAVNKLFGKKGKNYFKDALNKYPESYIELVIVETDELFSFSKIKSFVEAGNVNDTDLIIEALLIPMKNINDTIHSFLGEKQKLKKREEILSQLETIYGEKLNFLKEFFYQVD